jgi:predicted RNA binding protein YcfA (HicA-like mRNA interferase family)
MPRLPQASGRDLIRLLHSLGYETIRQKGSHVRLRKATTVGEHNLTVPDHKILAKGTLNDIPHERQPLEQYFKGRFAQASVS